MDEMMEVLRITTESGAVYDFSDEMARVRRANSDAWLRKDGEWIDVISAEDIAFGNPMRLLLAGVAEVGNTLRVTTPVTMIERTWTRQ